MVLELWGKYASIIYEVRERYTAPQAYQYFEYLYEVLVDIRRRGRHPVSGLKEQIKISSRLPLRTLSARHTHLFRKKGKVFGRYPHGGRVRIPPTSLCLVLGLLPSMNASTPVSVAAK